MCGGFSCSKNALISLNILYIVVGILLISVGVYGRAASIVTNLPIVSGILACGVLLILISLLGLVGAIKHHQVMLFFPKCCPPNSPSRCECSPCLPKLEDTIDYAFKLCGGIGLFFSFTEVLAVFIARRYRNMHNLHDLPARAIFPQRNYQY